MIESLCNSAPDWRSQRVAQSGRRRPGGNTSVSDNANNVADAFDVLLDEIEAQIGLTDKAALQRRIEMTDRHAVGGRAGV